MARNEQTLLPSYDTESGAQAIDSCGVCPVQRFFIADGREIRDADGFLDTSRTPRLVRLLDLLEHHPVSIVVGEPWLGKTTVATGTAAWLQAAPAICGFGARVTLTRLGLPGVERALEPVWWEAWRAGPPEPACWLLDGWDEGEDRIPGLGGLIAETLETLPEPHRRAVRVLLLSRPRPELGEVLARLRVPYSAPGTPGVKLLRLARLDRGTASEVVGEHFERVLTVVRTNALQQVAGFPSVLRFLVRHTNLDRLTIPDVWRGILRELLEDPAVQRRSRLRTTPDDRFRAASRVAAVLVLTHRDEIAEYDPDPLVPATTGLFAEGDDGARLRAAGAEALHFPVFVRAPDEGVYRFAHRNVRDWLAAFGLAGVHPRALRTALAGPDGRAHPRFRELLPLLRRIRADAEAVSEIDALSGGVTLPGGGIEPSLAESLRCLTALEEFAARSPYGLRLGLAGHEEFARMAADGLGAEIAVRLRDASKPAPVRELWLEVAYATDAVEAAEPALAIALDAAQPESLRVDAMMVACLHGGDAHLAPLSGFAEAPSGDDVTERLRAMLILELVRRRIWDRPRAMLGAPPRAPRSGDARGMLLLTLEQEMTVADARQVLARLPDLYRLALPIAQEWAQFAPSARPEDALRLGGRNVLLRLDPPAALGVLESEYAARGNVTVDETAEVWEHGFGAPGTAARWTVAELGRLLTLMARAYPFGADVAAPAEGDEDAGFTSAAIHPRWFRNHLFDTLLRTRTPEAEAVINAIAAGDTAAGNWVTAARAAEQARALLGAVSLSEGADPSAVGLISALRVLDSATYRLIRSNDDLMDVILEVLKVVEADVAADLPLLYGPPPRLSNKAVKGAGSKGTGARKHLQEDALQAYLRRRLCDLLPTSADRVRVEVLRENQVRYRRRLDLLVLAPCLGRRELAAVVVEVKWSDNDETNTSLEAQLGRKYLKSEGRTHGIYLVGWAGSWKGSGRKNVDQVALARHLVAQRDRYCASAGQGLRIEPVVLGLTWRDPIGP